MAGQGILWPAKEFFGRPKNSLAGQGILWPAKEFFGRPRNSLAGQRKIICNVDLTYYTRHAHTYIGGTRKDPRGIIVSFSFFLCLLFLLPAQKIVFSKKILYVFHCQRTIFFNNENKNIERKRRKSLLVLCNTHTYFLLY